VLTLAQVQSLGVGNFVNTQTLYLRPAPVVSMPLLLVRSPFPLQIVILSCCNDVLGQLLPS
jgi:hypothetical protein